MNIRHILLSIACTLATLLALNSCGSRKNNVGTDNYTAEPQWTDVSFPIRVSMQEPKKFSISGTAKLQRDEKISLSARMLGFEVASVYADRDSVIIYAKTLDLYYAENISLLSLAYGVTPTDIQNILLGKIEDNGKSRMSNTIRKFVEINAAETGNISDSGSEVSTTITNEKIGLTLTSSLNKAKWDADVEIGKPKISMKAKRVSTADILKILKAF